MSADVRKRPETVTLVEDGGARHPNPAVVMVLVLAGGALAAATLLVGARGNSASRTFVDTPEFLVWGLLIAAQGALWAVGGAVFLSTESRLQRRCGKGGAGAWVATGAFAAVLLVVVAYPLIRRGPGYSPLTHHSVRVTILGVFGGAVATVGVHVMARIASAAGAAAGRGAPLRERLERFLFLRGELHVVVLFLGGMVGAVTLGSGALRHALISKAGTSPEDFPPESVLAYGAYFSLLLAAAYTPAYRAVMELGRGVRDEVCGDGTRPRSQRRSLRAPSGEARPGGRVGGVARAEGADRGVPRAQGHCGAAAADRTRDPRPRRRRSGLAPARHRKVSLVERRPLTGPQPLARYLGRNRDEESRCRRR
jgi:hypothetical protein